MIEFWATLLAAGYAFMAYMDVRHQIRMENFKQSYDDFVEMAFKK